MCAVVDMSVRSVPILVVVLTVISMIMVGVVTPVIVMCLFEPVFNHQGQKIKTNHINWISRIFCAFNEFNSLENKLCNKIGINVLFRSITSNFPIITKAIFKTHKEKRCTTHTHSLYPRTTSSRIHRLCNESIEWLSEKLKSMTKLRLFFLLIWRLVSQIIID